MARETGYGHTQSRADRRSGRGTSKIRPNRILKHRPEQPDDASTGRADRHVSDDDLIERKMLRFKGGLSRDCVHSPGPEAVQDCRRNRATNVDHHPLQARGW